MSSEGSSARIGVLSLHNSKETKAILNAIEDLGHEPFWLREENTAVRLKDGQVTLEPDVDLVANRLLLSNTEQPSETLGLAKIYDGVLPVLNEPSSVMTAIHKFAAATTLAEAGLPVPDALMALSNSKLNRGRDDFGEEAVYKTAIGTHGGGTWKVGPDELVNPRVGDRQAFLQELIDRDEGRHRDLRVYVVGDRIVGAMNRYAPDNDWRTNVALGGDVEDATDSMPREVADIARDAAETIGLDYAGVDLIEGHDGWYVLEVNPTAGFKGLFKATERSAAPYIAQLAIERAGGSVDEAKVEDLAVSLDDSVPACKPIPEDTAPTEPVVIGYTEEVIVSGTSGSETITAKSDTGATRTSIDTKLAAKIGAGPIKSIARVKSGSSKSSRSRPVVDVVIGVGGNRHTVTASVEDRGHMDYPVLLGRDILKHYQVNVQKRVDQEEETEEEEEENVEE
ncbi:MULTISPECIES: ATP-grasp domain-containing protein [Halorussus]|uniref:ATP-grasp domain-containing protein n=1 Tax=Halorussus TaxID=1070314 RepID=UPI00209CD41F|nr:RimK family alpha-L-glutamate ligase [Halorussus vallis]USZ76525.1 RimK family alpha-L-glutamate ligase [Halorussus vallis]